MPIPQMDRQRYDKAKALATGVPAAAAGWTWAHDGTRTTATVAPAHTGLPASEWQRTSDGERLRVGPLASNGHAIHRVLIPGSTVTPWLKHRRAPSGESGLRVCRALPLHDAERLRLRGRHGSDLPRRTRKLVLQMRHRSKEEGVGDPRGCASKITHTSVPVRCVIFP